MKPATVLLVLAMCLGTMISMFNSTLVNVLVPAIGLEFSVPAADLEWVSAAYSLAYGSLLLLGGAIGVRFGRRLGFLLGTSVFLLGSVLCGLAPSAGLLLAGRVLQGVGVAFLLPQTLAILSTEFADPRTRAKVIGLWAGVSSLGLAAGPVLGGLIQTTLSWRYGFILSFVLALLAAITGWFGVPRSRHGRPDREAPIDWLAIGVWVAGLGLALGSFILVGRPGVSDLGIVLALLLGCGLVAVFLVGQARAEAAGRRALMPPSIFSSPQFLTASFGGVSYFFMFFAVLYFYSVALQDVRGYSSLVTGALFLPMMVAAAVLGPVAGRLVARFGLLPIFLTGSAVGALGCITLALEPADAPLWDLEWRFALVGIASGLLSSTLSNLATEGMHGGMASTAAAVHSVFRQIGSTLGVVVLGLVIAAVSASDGTDFSVAGLHVAMWITAVVLLVCAAVPLALRHRRIES